MEAVVGSIRIYCFIDRMDGSTRNIESTYRAEGGGGFGRFESSMKNWAVESVNT